MSRESDLRAQVLASIPDKGTRAAAEQQAAELSTQTSESGDQEGGQN